MAEYFFNHSVVLKDDEIRNYSEAIIQNLDLLLVKLEEEISGSVTARKGFDLLLDVLAENDINKKQLKEIEKNINIKFPELNNAGMYISRMCPIMYWKTCRGIRETDY